MLTKGELDTILEAWRIVALVLSSASPPPDASRELATAVRALERAYSTATS